MANEKNLYKEAGVDVAKGDQLVGWLQQDKHSIKHELGSVVSGIGGFAGLFRPDFTGIDDPIMVAGTDGVGTKVLLGIEQNQVEGLGVDLVAMCVNDLYTIGAKPMFFLDYYATGELEDDQFKGILKGIKDGLNQSNTLLLGGETAELPGLYEKGHFDLAGFVVGVVDGKKLLGPEKVRHGDKLVSFASNGFHSNGYSLLRKWHNDQPMNQDDLQRLLNPTKIYGQIPKLLSELPEDAFHALANITGGGISGNLPRVLPKDCKAVIKEDLVPTPDWMTNLCSKHGATFRDVEPVLNMGVGMIAVVEDKHFAEFMTLATKYDLDPVEIGDLQSHDGDAIVEYK